MAHAEDVEVVLNVPDGWAPNDEAFAVAGRILVAAAARAAAGENEATAA